MSTIPFKEKYPIVKPCTDTKDHLMDHRVLKEGDSIVKPTEQVVTPKAMPEYDPDEVNCVNCAHGHKTRNEYPCSLCLYYNNRPYFVKE